jgi:hypothetical protein
MLLRGSMRGISGRIGWTRRGGRINGGRGGEWEATSRGFLSRTVGVFGWVYIVSLGFLS